ncbi:MAG: hypothetical protein ACI358_05650 [Candidatus Limimorpha sp.]
MDAVISNPINSKQYRNVGLWLGILVFIRTQPCYFWAWEETIRPLCAIIIMVLCVMNMSHEKWTKWILLCFALAYIWASVFVDRSSIVTVFNFLAFAFIPTLKKEVVFETYKVFRKIFVFFLGFSIINYVLVLLGMDFISIVIEPLNKAKDYKYILHPFLVTTTSLELTRFHSIYDEPGFIGTLCGLMLIAERMNLQKRSNYILLLGGLISLSFYFYVAMIFGFVVFSTKLKKKWIYLALLLCFILVSYNNEFMYNTIWSRFEYDAETGKFVGDNRNSKVVDNVYESLLGTPLFYTGLGSAATVEYVGSASLKLIILKHGFIFVSLNLLGYLMLAIRQITNRKDLFFFFVFFVLTLYQRPGFYNTASIFMYVMVINIFGIVDVENKNKTKIVNNDS